MWGTLRYNQSPLRLDSTFPPPPLLTCLLLAGLLAALLSPGCWALLPASLSLRSDNPEPHVAVWPLPAHQAPPSWSVLFLPRSPFSPENIRELLYLLDKHLVCV